MIALLRGEVVDVSAGHLIVDVNGVGYLVAAPERVLLGAAHGESITLHVSTIVREDAFLLYGFTATEDRQAFDILRSVNKIGPKNALNVLSHLSLPDLAAAVAGDDVRALTRAPGIGKRTAERLCLELKGKLPAAFGLSGTAPAAPSRPAANDPLALALAQLDYRKTEIDMAIGAEGVPALGAASVEERLRAALRVLARPM